MVLHDDELRRLAAAARDREECVHAELLNVLLVEDGHLESVALAHFPRLVGKIHRRANVARQIAEILRERDALGNRHGALDRSLRRRPVRGIRDVENHFLQCTLDCGTFALQLVEAIEAIHHGKHCLLDLPRDVPAVHVDLVEADGRLRGTGRAQRLDRRAHRGAITALDEFALRAQADEQHALRGNFRNVVEEEVPRSSTSLTETTTRSTAAGTGVVDSSGERKTTLALKTVESRNGVANACQTPEERLAIFTLLDTGLRLREQ